VRARGLVELHLRKMAADYSLLCGNIADAIAVNPGHCTVGPFQPLTVKGIDPEMY